MPLSISLFGPFSTRRDDGVQIRFRSRKSAEIVAILALAPAHRRSRMSLVEDVWPGENPEAARRNLRTCLAYARRDIGVPDVLSCGQEFVQLDAAVRTDIAEAERFRLRVEMSSNGPERLEALHRLEEVLRKPLLESWDAPWVDQYRDQFKDQRVEALVELAQGYEEEANFFSALAHAEEALMSDEFREAAISCVLRTLASQGRVTEASERYRLYSSRLESLMNLEPSAPLRRLASRIRTGRYESTKTFADVEERDLALQVFELALESNPSGVLSLLSGAGMSWRSVSKGAEMIPLLTKVLERTSGWGPERRRVCIDLVVALLHAGRHRASLDWARTLEQGVESGSYEAYVAKACALLARTELGELQDFDDEYQRLIKFAEDLGNAYQIAVSQANYASRLIDERRFEEGEALLTACKETLATDDTEKGRQVRLEIEEISMQSLCFQGDFRGAEALGRDIDLQRKIFGIGHIETGGSGAHGYAAVRMQSESGPRRIADGVTLAFRQRRMSIFCICLDYASAAMVHLGKRESGLELAAHVMRKRLDEGIHRLLALDTLVNEDFAQAIQPSKARLSDLALAELAWRLLTNRGAK